MPQCGMCRAHGLMEGWFNGWTGENVLYFSLFKDILILSTRIMVKACEIEGISFYCGLFKMFFISLHSSFPPVEHMQYTSVACVVRMSEWEDG